jgi:hypothetical protein
MVEGAEGVGEAVTGGVLARAVEPAAGEAGDAHPAACLNCKAELVGEYCHRCGQQGHVHRSLAAFGHDILHGVLHFEGKIWRTLPLLAWRPGELTRRYVEGERATFVSPLALFLFSVFLMFAVFSTVGGPFPMAGSRTETEIRAEQTENRQTLARLEKQRAEAVAAKRDTAAVDEEIAEKRQELGAVNMLLGEPAASHGGVAPLEAAQAAAEAGPTVAEVANTGMAGTENWFRTAYKKAKENPSLLIYKLQNNAYKFSWALIPISVPFVWMLFLHRRRYRQYRAYDHSVFVTYSISFVTLLMVAATGLRLIGLSDGWTLFALTLIPLVHMYKQLKGAYGLSRFSAGWRTLVLSQFAIFAASLFFLLLLMIGVA